MTSSNIDCVGLEVGAPVGLVVGDPVAGFALAGLSLVGLSLVGLSLVGLATGACVSGFPSSAAAAITDSSGISNSMTTFLWS